MFNLFPVLFPRILLISTKNSNSMAKVRSCE
uniref:Uncharacterized protein n=1 Tax=Arundo donax TaxID=35708 RepID=A0A0A9FNL0_ARUDO